MEKRDEPDVRFIGEQDGTPERELKAEFCQLFADRPHIRSAYLAQVAFVDSEPTEVVFAVQSTTGDDLELVRAICECFAQRFRRDAHLDIMFMTAEQAIDAAAVCKAFYCVPGHEICTQRKTDE